MTFVNIHPLSTGILALAAALPATAPIGDGIEAWLERGVALAIAVFVIRWMMKSSEDQQKHFINSMNQSLMILERSVSRSELAHESVLKGLTDLANAQKDMARTMDQIGHLLERLEIKSGSIS